MTDRLERQAWMVAPATTAVLDALQRAGGEARFVGGCVRDALLGRPVGDIDIATPLTPPEVIRALDAAGLRAIPTGVEHGTVTALSERKPFEITTLRRDVETDGRRAVVAFTTDWAQDAARRDFRLNALYLDREGRLYDPVGGGIEDARAGRIVFVGDAETRIREDYLRVLRFFRFFAWYGRGEPDAAALAACEKLRDGLAALSGERVSKELLKLLAAEEPRPAVRLMAGTGVLAVLLPVEANLRRFEAMVEISRDPELRLAALLPDAMEAVLAASRRLRLSNAQRDRLLAALPGEPALDAGLSGEGVRRALYAIGPDAFCDRVRLAWAAAPGDAWPRLLALADGWSRPRFPLTGADAKAAGVAAGPAMGAWLKAAEAWWVAQDFRPGRDAILAHMAEQGG